MARAGQYTRKEIESGAESDCSVSSLDRGIYDPNKFHRPDKKAKLVAIRQTISQRKRRSLNSAAFNTALTKCKSHRSYTKVTDKAERGIGWVSSSRW